MALGLLVVRFLRKVFGLKFAVQRRMLTQHRLVPSRNPKQTLVFFALADTTESDIQSFDAFLGWALGTMGCEGIVSGQVGPSAFAPDFDTRWKTATYLFYTPAFIPRRTRLRQWHSVRSTGDAGHGENDMDNKWLVS